MVLAIVSHGDVDGEIYTNDGGIYLNQLFQFFGSNKCPVLKGKPKIILKTVRLFLNIDNDKITSTNFLILLITLLLELYYI